MCGKLVNTIASHFAIYAIDAVRVVTGNKLTQKYANGFSQSARNDEEDDKAVSSKVASISFPTEMYSKPRKSRLGSVTYGFQQATISPQTRHGHMTGRSKPSHPSASH